MNHDPVFVAVYDLETHGLGAWLAVVPAPPARKRVNGVGSGLFPALLFALTDYGLSVVAVHAVTIPRRLWCVTRRSA